MGWYRMADWSIEQLPGFALTFEASMPNLILMLIGLASIVNSGETTDLSMG